MDDVIKLFDKLIESWKGSKTSLIVVAVLAVLIYKLVEHFLPKLFSGLFNNIGNYLKTGSTDLKTELRIRKFITTSANINWVGSIKSLAKYHTNIGLLKVFHPVTFQKRNSSTKGSLELKDILFESNILVIIGKPGSGKSSLINFVGETYARDLALEKFDLREVRIPIILTLRHIKTLDIHFPDLLSHYLTERGCEVDSKFIKRKLEKGKCIILLDGLDEITNIELRKSVVSWISNLLSSYQGNRFIVTCRDIDWLSLKIPALDEYYIADLNIDQTRTIINNWSKSLHGELQQQLQHLHAEVQNDNRLVSFCSNPLLLTIVIILTANKIMIPHKRGQIYKTFLEVLLKEWSEIKDSSSPNTLENARSVINLLQRVAYYLLQESRKNEVIDMEDIGFLTFLSQNEKNDAAQHTTTDFASLFQSLSTTGIIAQLGDGAYAFSNRGFLEYLASQEILKSGTKAIILTQFEQESWSETILLILESEENTQLMREFLSINRLITKPSYYRTLSELLVRNLVPFEYKDLTEKNCMTHLLSANSDQIDQKLFNNLYRNNKSAVISLFREVLGVANETLFQQITFAFCNISDARVMTEIESVFPELPHRHRKFIIESLSHNTLSEEFIWSCMKKYLLKDDCISSLVAKGPSIYNRCLIKLVEEGKTVTDPDELLSKKLAFDVLHHFERPELLTYLSDNLNKISIELRDHIGATYADTYTSILQNYVTNSKYKKYIKRPWETALAIGAFVLLSPVILLVAIAVKLEARAPVFIRVNRIGMNGKKIMVYKFRTLVVDYAANALQSTKNDSRVKRLGRFLRRSGLDELPLLLSVIKGDLALVGPTMLPFNFLEAYPHVYDPIYKNFRPGLTSRARIMGHKINFNRLDKMSIKHDLNYTYRCNLWMDISIIAYTPLAIFRDERNAY